MKQPIATLTFVAAVLFGPTFASAASAQKKERLPVVVYVNAAAQAVSPEGFVDSSNAWLLDSVSDLKKSLDGKTFKPNKTCPGSEQRYTVTNDPDGADVTLTVAARGTSSESIGQRTTMKVYENVVTAETVPTVGVTRWVSIVLKVDTYQKEFLAWSTNRSRFSAGAWTADAKLLASLAACWVMVNETRIVERQKTKTAAPR